MKSEDLDKWGWKNVHGGRILVLLFEGFRGNTDGTYGTHATYGMRWFHWDGWQSGESAGPGYALIRAR